MFLLKKAISPLFSPLPLCLGFLLAGLLLLWFTRRQRLGKTLVTIGLVQLLAASNFAASSLLLSGIERRYPALAFPGEAAGNSKGVKYIVVLAGGGSSQAALPPTSQLAADTSARLVEGIRLYRLTPRSRLLLSGGSYLELAPSAETMARAAVALGVHPADIALESESADTADQARLIAPVVGQSPFFLVTSAAHIPRAMLEFRQRGAAPIAAPADYLASRAVFPGPDGFYPNARALLRSEVAFHEYLGLLWNGVRRAAKVN